MVNYTADNGHLHHFKIFRVTRRLIEQPTAVYSKHGLAVKIKCLHSREVTIGTLAVSRIRCNDLFKHFQRFITTVLAQKNIFRRRFSILSSQLHHRVFIIIQAIVLRLPRSKSIRPISVIIGVAIKQPRFYTARHEIRITVQLCNEKIQFGRRTRYFVFFAVYNGIIIYEPDPAHSVSKKISRPVRVFYAVQQIRIILFANIRIFTVSRRIEHIVKFCKIIVIHIGVEHGEIQIIRVVFARL